MELVYHFECNGLPSHHTGWYVILVICLFDRYIIFVEFVFLILFSIWEMRFDSVEMVFRDHGFGFISLFRSYRQKNYSILESYELVLYIM